MKKEIPSSSPPGKKQERILSNDPGETGIVCPAARTQKEFGEHIRGLEDFYKDLSEKNPIRLLFRRLRRRLQKTTPCTL